MVTMIAQNSQARHKVAHSILKCFWVVLAIFLCLLFQKSSLQELTSGDENLSIKQKTVKLQAKGSKLALLAKTPTFGLDNVLANYIFLDFLQYFGDIETRKELDYNLVISFFEGILAHTPHYRQFYFFLSGSGSLYAAQPQESIMLIEKGLQELSPNQPDDSYYIWRYKGVDELLFLGDGEAAQQSFETSVLWAEQSDHPDSEVIGQLSKQTARYLALNPQSEFAQVQAWSSILATAFNERTQKQAIERIRKLGGRVTISEGGEFKVEFSPKDLH
ncbi:MAG: hypothetical protein AAFV90_00940 [Cyanobacteria bacterium J06634_5]